MKRKLKNRSKIFMAVVLSLLITAAAVPAVSAAGGIYDIDPPYECELNGEHFDINEDGICDCCGTDISDARYAAEKTESGKGLPFDSLHELIKAIISFFLEILGINL